MDLRLATNITPEMARRLDEFLARCPNAHFTMHPGWAELPPDDARGSWHLLTGEVAEELRAAALARVRRVPLLGDSLVDIFRGPAALTAADFLAMVETLPGALKPLRPLALRLDPNWSGPDRPEVAAGLARLGFTEMAERPWSARSLETPIDVEPEAFMATFKGNTRRDVQKALRMDVEARFDLDDAGLDAFHTLYRAMVDRKGAEFKTLEFFRGVRDLFRRWPKRGFFVSSWLGTEMLGAIAVFTVGPRAYYAYGASATTHPEIPKNHLLQYQAMVRARELGSVLYDMGGFSAGVGTPESRTPAQKINFFKSGFGGREVEVVPGVELVLNPALLGLIRAAERIRKGRP